MHLERIGHSVRYGLTALTILVWGMAITVSAAPQNKEVRKGPHHELKSSEKFLDDHPSIAADLAQDPSLISNQDYLAHHAELRQFLQEHPGVLQEMVAKNKHCSVPIPAIFDRASPAVVFIYTTSINPYRVTDRVQHFVGSGFIFDESGLILTNAHVAFGRQTLVVTLDDGTSLPAELVGADPIFDIAVLSIPKPEKGMLPVIKLGDSDQVHVGEEALAIGNPLGLDQSLTRGIVSAINRVLPETFFSLQEPLIQIDVPINPGNSGGPLLNRCGEVIGITTAIIPDANSIGFAVPINLAKAVVPSLVEQGHLVRPWLGFHGQFVGRELQNLLKIPLDVGFLVEVVEPGSPAAEAELRGGGLEFTIATRDYLLGGDIITKMNGKPLTSPDNVIEALEAATVGSTINLTLFRDGKYVEVNYMLPERPLLPGDIPSQGTAVPLSKGSLVKGPPRSLPFRF